jgi:flagellar hook protein FlgE
MSLFGAMNTAISGLGAQSSAFGNISDNVANSQTVGFKRTDTAFIDYLTNSTAAVNSPGAVVARPNYVNGIEGSIQQTDNPLAMAITGQGFFAVSEATGQTNSGPVFSPQQYYSRAGDFQLDKSGYFVNSAGEYLNGWTSNPATGVLNQNSLQPVQLSQLVYNPVATGNIDLAANLPATPASGTATASSPITTDVSVYDQVGTQHTVTLGWVQNSAGNWTVSVTSPDDTASTSRGSANVQFGAASGNSVPEGTIGQIGTAAGSVTTAGYTAGSPATLSFTTNFGAGAQTITLDLGTYGATSGLTQYAGSQYSPRSVSQDGVQPGSYTGVAVQSNGSVVATYDNGKTSRIAQIPLITFSNPNALQRQNGQAFTATEDSGTPNAQTVGTNGAGNLLTKSVEGSNVDIATEFSQLIVAQQAYSANAKIVTTADTLLQTTLQMKQ